MRIALTNSEAPPAARFLKTFPEAWFQSYLLAYIIKYTRQQLIIYICIRIAVHVVKGIEILQQI